MFFGLLDSINNEAQEFCSYAEIDPNILTQPLSEV